MVRLIFIGLSLLCMGVYADVYRTVDEDGNIIFSDESTPGAEKVELREAQTINLPPAAPVRRNQPKISTERYKTIEITAPVHDATIRDNTGNVSVSVALTPDLSRNDELVLYLDGKEYKSGESTFFQLQNLDRGTHNLRVTVKNTAGKIIKSSKTVTVHLFRHSNLHAKP